MLSSPAGGRGTKKEQSHQIFIYRRKLSLKADLLEIT